MYSFFVLGIIPGTTFQITFQLWLDCLLVGTDVIGIWWLYKRYEVTLTPYLHTSTARPLVHRFGKSMYQNVGRCFKLFLESQAASWQEF